VRTETPDETGDLWGFTGLDEDFRLVNQMIKYVKFGFGHVTDQVVEAINNNMMTRDEGLELVRRFDGKCAPSFIDRFCAFLEITHEEFWRVVESYRRPEMWHRDIAGQWQLR
jgi:hypothetical protein